MKQQFSLIIRRRVGFFFRFNLASRPAGNSVKSTQTCVLSPHSGAETLQYCFILSQHTNLHSQAKSSRRTLRPDTEVWLSCFPHLNSSCITFLSETVWTLVCFMPSWHFRHYRLSATGFFKINKPDEEGWIKTLRANRKIRRMHSQSTGRTNRKPWVSWCVIMNDEDVF